MVNVTHMSKQYQQESHTNTMMIKVGTH